MNAVDLFRSRYSYLYHVAFGQLVESIRKHGLLSTSTLLEEAGVSPARREELTTRRRPESVAIQSPLMGEIWIRDQKPVNEKRLSNCLEGCTVAEYLEFLNAHVFLWPTVERADTMLGAAAYAGTHQVLLHLDSRSFLERYAETVLLSPINSGATLYNARPRGIHTFQPLADFPLQERLSKQGRKGAVAEVLVPGGIRDIREYMVATETR